MSDRLFELRRAIVADGLEGGVHFDTRDLETLARWLESEGRRPTIIRLSLLGKALDRGLVGGLYTSPTNQKCKRDSVLPRFGYSLFRRVFDDGGALLTNPCVSSISFLRQFLLLDSKLESIQPIKGEDAVFADFQERQARLRRHAVPTDHPILVTASQLLTKVLAGCSLRHLRPKHGPGAVAEGLDQDEKWDFTTWPQRAERFYPFSEYAQYLVPLAHCSKDRMLRVRGDTPTRVCLVPKDFKGSRLISAESVATQYLQQGQMQALMRHMSQQPLLQRSVNIQDQNLNKARAMFGVEDGLVTLDLSNASDTVSLPLVWFLFKGLPDLRRRLCATRSTHASFRGQVVRLSAFSPMGSAVCFPVETLVFWALAMSATRIDPVFRHSSWNEIASKVAVYGDDIVIPDTTLNFLTDILLKVGCEPNQDKTCWLTPFRESCGGEWFNHTDVSIIRNRRYTYEAATQTVTYHDLLNLARQFAERGYWRSSCLTTSWAEEFHPVVARSLSPMRARLSYLQGGDGDSLETCGESILSHGNIHDASHRQRFLALRGIQDGVRFSGYDPAQRVDRLSLLAETLPTLDHDSYPVSYTSITECETRWNTSYHRLEYKIPVVLQKTREWRPTSEQRLLARLLGDATERVALRGRKTKRAWIWIPNRI